MYVNKHDNIKKNYIKQLFTSPTTVILKKSTKYEIVHSRCEGGKYMGSKSFSNPKYDGYHNDNVYDHEQNWDDNKNYPSHKKYDRGNTSYSVV